MRQHHERWLRKAYLLQNKLNLNVAEVLQTYVYKVGLINAQYSFSAAINLFSTVINIILLLVMNQIVKSLATLRCCDKEW